MVDPVPRKDNLSRRSPKGLHYATPAGGTVAQRVLVVGWDGADWEIVDDLLGRGLLPNLQAMLEEGGRGTLLSSIPSQSWSAWTSFLTGYHPATHGVWDFVERDP